MIKKSKKKIDYFLFGIIASILLFGILILTSISAPHAANFTKRNLDQIIPAFFLKHQILFGLIPGLILAYIASRISLEKIRKIAPILFFMNLIVVGLVFVPQLGIEIQGAKRWLSLGFTSVQPSEFLKLTFILYLATWLTSKTKKSNNKKQTLGGLFVIIGLISLLLILQPDIGTLGVIIATGSIMYFIADTPLFHSIILALIEFGGLYFLINVASYRVQRIKVFLNPELDPLGAGYQMKQALISIGSGGITGRGLGMSIQKFGFVPEPISDSIFALYAEETGLIGAVILISLFIVFFIRSIYVGISSKDTFFKLTAFGISFWIILQAFVNIGAIIGILPLTGIPLPFISYGGTALLTELIGVGILLNISRHI